MDDRTARDVAAQICGPPTVGNNRGMASLLIVTGPPGAGKSTVARILADRFESSVLVEGDAFFAFLARGAIQPWLPASTEQNEIVTQAAAAAAGRYVSGGYETLYDGVIGPWSLAAFAEATGLDCVDYVLLLPSVDRCLERVTTRQGHGFRDKAATRKMHQEFAEADIARRHVLIDPPDQPKGVADLVVAALETESLRYRRPPS
jgi:predicted ABC-type ATPase